MNHDHPRRVNASLSNAEQSAHLLLSRTPLIYNLNFQIQLMRKLLSMESKPLRR
ncbi:hypothetical protein D3C77_814210 [compost metagenome]